MKKILYFLLPFAINHCLAQTTVSGHITSNTTWTLAGSPYIIDDTLIVDPGVTLTIQPGVTIKIEEYKDMVVNGTIRAIGTAGSMILFTSNEFIPSQWGKIYLSDSAEDYDFTQQTGCIFQYCKLEYGGGWTESTVIKANWSSPFIDHCFFTKCNGAIFMIAQGAEVRVTNNQFIDLSTSSFPPRIVILDYVQPATIEVSCNLFYSIQSPSEALAGRITLLSNNLFIANDCMSSIVAGAVQNASWNSIIDHDPQTNLLVNNGWGTCSNNLITRNYSSASSDKSFLVNGDSLTIFSNNNWFNNTDGNGQMHFFNSVQRQWLGTPPTNAENNYWGTTDANMIDEMIRDYYDDTTITILDYSPFLTAPDIIAPISPPMDVTKTDQGGGSVLVTWDPNPEADVAGYKIYWGSPTGYAYSNSIDAGNVTSYTLSGFDINDTIAVTAYDLSADGSNDQCEGNESWYTVAEAFTGIESIEFGANDFYIYPNPAFDYLLIETKFHAPVKKLSIQNLLGQYVMSDLPLLQHGNNFIIDVSELPAGSYTVLVETIKGLASKMFVKD